MPELSGPGSKTHALLPDDLTQQVTCQWFGFHRFLSFSKEELQILGGQMQAMLVRLQQTTAHQSTQKPSCAAQSDQAAQSACRGIAECGLISGNFRGRQHSNYRSVVLYHAAP